MANSFAYRAEQKGLHFLSFLSPDVPSRLIGDPGRLRQMLVNLTGNALKFTDPGGNITISAIQDDHTVEISVSDTGIGIAEEHLPELFRIDTKYKRSGTANEPGTGLGLLLCKEFVERNDGSIQVESEIGKGSTFKITLPKASGKDAPNFIT